MRIIALSDTHGLDRDVKVPDGDVLIHAGDCTNTGKYQQLKGFLNWFSSFPHPNKILIAGNHDWVFESHPDLAKEALSKYGGGVTYLQDSGVEIDGVKFWGSPVQPEFCEWAFNRRRGDQIKSHWDKIPDNTDVLITHGPPAGILDSNKERLDGRIGFGCKDLYEAILRVKPLTHIFGHIHGGYGSKVLYHPGDVLTRLYNVAVCTEAYIPTNPVTVIDL